MLNYETLVSRETLEEVIGGQLFLIGSSVYFRTTRFRYSPLILEIQFGLANAWTVMAEPYVGVFENWSNVLQKDATERQ